MKNFSFLFWAYTVVWIGIAGYICFLVYRLAKVTRRLDSLERSVGKDRSY